MPGEYGCHDAIAVGVLAEEVIVRGSCGSIGDLQTRQPPRDDPRWPIVCGCGYCFTETDEWQLFAEAIYTRSDTGANTTIRDAGAGALWFATWLEGKPWSRSGPDGRVLMCRTPGGEWNVDSIASNCTRRDDDVHRCWVRHGDPTDPQGLRTGQPLHVDKNGNTCAAGAGSIQCGSYHGFLHSGALVQT
jgi:hypothetical protein